MKIKTKLTEATPRCPDFFSYYNFSDPKIIFNIYKESILRGGGWGLLGQ